VLEFERYGLRTVAINEDCCYQWGHPKRSWALEGLALGDDVWLFFDILACRNTGHFPRLARLIVQNDQLFRKRIIRVYVDEAHFIFSISQKSFSVKRNGLAKDWYIQRTRKNLILDLHTTAKVNLKSLFTSNKTTFLVKTWQLKPFLFINFQMSLLALWNFHTADSFPLRANSHTQLITLLDLA
jgi:hypothetical protein